MCWKLEMKSIFIIVRSSSSFDCAHARAIAHVLLCNSILFTSQTYTQGNTKAIKNSRAMMSYIEYR